MSLAGRLGSWVHDKRLGNAYLAGTGFWIDRDPDTVRARDVAFVRAERATQEPQRGYFEGPPDLTVEVLAPEDRASGVLANVGDWLEAGCRLVWVPSPESRTATVYRSLSDIRVLTKTDVRSGEDVVPGLAIPLVVVFRR